MLLRQGLAREFFSEPLEYSRESQPHLRQGNYVPKGKAHLSPSRCHGGPAKVCLIEHHEPRAFLILPSGNFFFILLFFRRPPSFYRRTPVGGRPDREWNGFSSKKFENKTKTVNEGGARTSLDQSRSPELVGKPSQKSFTRRHNIVENNNKKKIIKKIHCLYTYIRFAVQTPRRRSIRDNGFDLPRPAKQFLLKNYYDKNKFVRTKRLG